MVLSAVTECGGNFDAIAVMTILLTVFLLIGMLEFLGLFVISYSNAFSVE